MHKFLTTDKCPHKDKCILSYNCIVGNYPQIDMIGLEACRPYIPLLITNSLSEDNKSYYMCEIKLSEMENTSPTSRSVAGMTAELMRDDKNIVMVTPEMKRQIEAARDWYERTFKPAVAKFERQNASNDASAT